MHIFKLCSRIVQCAFLGNTMTSRRVHLRGKENIGGRCRELSLQEEKHSQAILGSEGKVVFSVFLLKCLSQ